jgi:hypothetical protein
MIDYREGIREIKARMASHTTGREDIVSSHLELARLIRRLEEARRQFHRDLETFMDQDEYFDYELWERKNESRDRWLSVADKISTMKLTSSETSQTQS